MFKSATEKFEENQSEEFLYGVVAKEVALGKISPGLYAKALAESDGDEQKAKARYISLRVQSIRAELAAKQEEERDAQAKQERLAREALAQERGVSQENQSGSGSGWSTFGTFWFWGWTLAFASEPFITGNFKPEGWLMFGVAPAVLFWSIGQSTSQQ